VGTEVGNHHQTISRTSCSVLFVTSYEQQTPGNLPRNIAPLDAQLRYKNPTKSTAACCAARWASAGFAWFSAVNSLGLFAVRRKAQTWKQR